jgi:uncharacterized membrane protein
MFVALIVVVSAGLFAGAALYVSLVEHPARVACGTEVAVTEFGPSYKRGAVLQASLAAIGTVAAVFQWTLHGSSYDLAGAVLLGSAIPFTLLVILPTNRRLLDPRLDRTSLEAAQLLQRWGRLHAVRTLTGALAFLLFAWRLVDPTTSAL